MKEIGVELQEDGKVALWERGLIVAPSEGKEDCEVSSIFKGGGELEEDMLGGETGPGKGGILRFSGGGLEGSEDDSVELFEG